MEFWHFTALAHTFSTCLTRILKIKRLMRKSIEETSFWAEI
jgi:hypothetical protein